MPPVNGAFAKLVTVDTTVTSLVVGGATGSASTGTGGIVAGNAALNKASDPLTAPLTLRGGGSAGAYTLVNSGVVYKDAAGTEQGRIWFTDPDDANFNSFNVYIGCLAGAAQPTDNVDAGFFNVGIGGRALTSIDTGGGNIAIGVDAGAAITSGSDNILIGTNTGLALVTSNANILIGSQVASLLENSDANVLIGNDACADIVAGDRNVAIGTEAFSHLSGGTDSDNNVCLGYQAAAGFGAGASDLLLANRGVFIGSGCRSLANNSINEIVIGESAIGAGDNTATIGNSSVLSLTTPRSIIAKFDGSNNFTLAVSSTGTATFTATGSTAGLAMATQYLLTAAITPTALSGNTDNWNPTGLGTANVIRLSASGPVNLTGIVAQPSGTMLLLYNAGTQTVVLIHNATSTAVNRFFCRNDTDMDLATHESCFIRYDGTDQRWCVTGPV